MRPRGWGVVRPRPADNSAKRPEIDHCRHEQDPDGPGPGQGHCVGVQVSTELLLLLQQTGALLAAERQQSAVRRDDRLPVVRREVRVRLIMPNVHDRGRLRCVFTSGGADVERVQRGEGHMVSGGGDGGQKAERRPSSSGNKGETLDRSAARGTSS